MKTYSFKVVVEPDDDRWHAYCPALQQYGASTWGNTEEEAFKHIHEVVRMISPSREPARRRRGAAGHTGCGDRVTWQSSMAA
jgi:predicted RNase H-like HicB family nuclease